MYDDDLDDDYNVRLQHDDDDDDSARVCGPLHVQRGTDGCRVGMGQDGRHVRRDLPVSATGGLGQSILRDHDDDLHADDDDDNADPAGLFGVVRFLVGPDVRQLATNVQRLRERRGRLLLRSTVVQRERMRPRLGPVFVAVERVNDDHYGGPLRLLLHDVNDDVVNDHDQGLRVVVRLEVFERRRGVLQSVRPVRADLPLPVAGRYSLG